LKDSISHLKTLILDLDETLVHSSFDSIENPDVIIPILVDNTVYEIFVLIRPGVFEFIDEMASYYEIIIYTASMAKVFHLLICSMLTHSLNFWIGIIGFPINYLENIAHILMGLM